MSISEIVQPPTTACMTTSASAGDCPGPCLIAAQPVDAGLNVARANIECRLAHPQATPNFIGVDAVASRGQYLRPPDRFLRRIAVGNQGPQPLPIPGNRLSPHHLGYTRTLKSNPPDRTLLFPGTARTDLQHRTQSPWSSHAFAPASMPAQCSIRRSKGSSTSSSMPSARTSRALSNSSLWGWT